MNDKTIVLDFDGTIFDLFCNYNMDNTKKTLVNLLKDYDMDFDMKNDAFDVFQKIFHTELNNKVKENLLKKADCIIRNAEVEALNTGVLIDSFSHYLKWIDTNAIPLIVATNNSEECVREFFKKYYNRTDCIVIGRNYKNPDLMKPNPFMLTSLFKKLNLTKDNIYFVGDSIRDYKCAKAFGCKFIGMGALKRKRDILAQYKKEILIVENYVELINNKLLKNEE